MQTNNVTFFLGANSAEGFFSLQEEYLSYAKRRRIFILKGGPGTGKSALMRSLAKKGESLGLPVEYYACASDPESLDGVVFPTLGAGIFDGTAPHVMEPRCIGAVEEYVSLCELWDRKKIIPHRREIEALQAESKGEYEKATRFLSAVAALYANNLDIALKGVSAETAARRGRALARRYIPGEKNPGGRIQRRFLSGFTPEGTVCLRDTVYNNYKTVVVLRDRYGLAPFVLSPVITAAKNAGLLCLVCLSPLNPKKTEHLLLPELSLAFVTSTPEVPFTPMGARCIRADRICDEAYIAEKRESLRDNERRARELSDCACICLANAKKLHDRIEGYYTPAVNFRGMDRLEERLSGELFGG